MLPASNQSAYTGGGDSFRSQHWDTAALATSTDRYTLFTTPQSATKNLGQTSMTEAGRFAAGVNFFVHRIGFRLVPIEAAVAVVDADFLAGYFAWAAGVTVTLNMTGKENMGEWHFTNWFGSVNVAVENDASDGYTSVLSQAPNWYSVLSGNNSPIPLRAQQNFNILIENHETTTPSILNTYRLVCILDGIEQRVN